MRFFERFSNVYCINLKERTDRLENFIYQVDKYDLGEFDILEAVDGKKIKKLSTLLPGEIGVIESVINILNESIKNNYDTILIIEDDCVFSDEIEKINEYFNELPDNWQMLYFGGNHNTHMGMMEPFKINNKVVKLHSTFSAHCTAIKKEMFSVILTELKKYDTPLDVVYQKLQNNHNIYSFTPAIAKQLIGFSDIQNKNVDYNWLIK